MRSVVRRDCQRRAFAKFVFEDDEILVSEADDGVNFATERMKFARDRKRDGASYAAADDTYLFKTFRFGRPTERSDKVLYLVSDFF